MILLSSAIHAADEPTIRADVVFRGGTVVDGTGAQRRKADVAIRGGRVVAVGAFKANARVVNVDGLIVAPGFIDLHTHSDEAILKPATRANLNYQAQGVTTVVTGNCGGGALEVANYLDAIDDKGAGTNVIHLVPLGSVRSAVMKNAERAPSSGELKQMQAYVDRGVRAGAWGVSSGLIYMPGRYARTDELIALARVAQRYGGIYASHIRNEEDKLLASIDEALAIGQGAKVPVHISHLKANGKANWGKAKDAIAKITAARESGAAVTADQYPYIASSTSLAAMVIPHWALQGDTKAFAAMADDSVQGVRLREAIEKELDLRENGKTVRISRYAPVPARVGKDLVTIATLEKTTPVELVIDIQRHGGAQAISFGMSEDDVRAVMKEPFVATASDGGAHRPNSGDQPHPRAYGTFPRKIRYALDSEVITLEQAIHSCTGLPAEILRISDRGVLRPGAVADIVVFDPNVFRDAATFEDPTRYANGVRHLYVNGVAVIDDGKLTNKLPGRALRLQKDGLPDTILTFNRIWTGNPDNPWAEAIAARNGEILALGNRKEIRELAGPNTRMIDQPDAFAVPGLIDAHGHISGLGEGLEYIDLRGVASVEEVARRVKERMDKSPGDSWIMGRSWDQSLWPGGAFPTAAVIDAVAPGRPVWLRRVDGHAIWANSEAMRRAKITKTTKAPSDGQILRDADGNATGVFIDGAMDLISKAMPKPTKAEITRRVLAAQKQILHDGLTGVHDAGLDPLDIEVYRELDRAGKLKLRVYGMALLPTGKEVAFVSKPPPPGHANGRFTLRAVKIFIDGAMGSSGALLFEPYSDDPKNKGLLLFEPKLLEAVTTAALKSGWQVCTHAIGDKGNALVLDAFDAALKAVPTARDARLRIEHAQVVRKEDVLRFKALGVIASMQPSHSSDDMRWADARLGPGRVQGAYAWRWFLDAKVPLAFGSDFPVEIVSPFWGLYAAITRQDAKGFPEGGWHPDQRMSMEETLHAYTAGSAFAQFAEDKLGTLREGLRADLTVIDRDLFKASPKEVLEAKVLMTVIDGDVVFDAKATE